VLLSPAVKPPNELSVLLSGQGGGESLVELDPVGSCPNADVNVVVPLADSVPIEQYCPRQSALPPPP
jgi:hypothetical protein